MQRIIIPVIQPFRTHGLPPHYHTVATHKHSQHIKRNSYLFYGQLLACSSGDFTDLLSKLIQSKFNDLLKSKIISWKTKQHGYQATWSFNISWSYSALRPSDVKKKNQVLSQTKYNLQWSKWELEVKPNCLKRWKIAMTKIAIGFWFALGLLRRRCKCSRSITVRIN